MVNLLDFGYIKLIETWGSDERIIEAARMSTDKGFQGWGPKVCSVCLGRGWSDSHVERGVMISPVCQRCEGTGKVPGDEKLLRYLWTQKHLTPFEMAGAIFEVQAPIFVFREWHRHRTQSYNELSARYTPIPDVNYVPTIDRIFLNAGTTNKQAQGTALGSIDLGRFDRYIKDLVKLYAQMEDFYREGLAIGVPKELARIVLPVGRYSRMRASANLRNWLSFLTLRNDEAAQYEIQVYAKAAQQLLKEAFPRTIALFEESA